MAHYTYTPAGVPVRQVMSHESYINIHPDHTGLIIGRGGSTIQKIQRDTGVDVLRIRKPNQMSGGMPWIQIRGHIKSVESAYQRVLTIAQEAERRIPRMNVRHTQSSQVPPPAIQHPFGSNKSQRSRPPPLQMPHPDTVAQQMGFSNKTESAYEPVSPDYRPNSPAYCPHSPEYRPSSPTLPPGPRSPSVEPPRTPSPEPPRLPSVEPPRTPSPTPVETAPRTRIIRVKKPKLKAKSESDVLQQ